MADHIPLFACGWETGSVLEANHRDGAAPVSVPACFSVVAAAGTLMQGSYMLEIDYSATAGSMSRSLTESGSPTTPAKGLGFDIEFVTNGANADNIIIGIDNNNLSGFFLRRRVSDQKLEVSSYDGVTVAFTSANAYTSGEYHIQIRAETGAMFMRIYDSTLSLVEDLSASVTGLVTGSLETLRIGQVAGAPTAGKYNLDNVYVIKTVAWPPLHPTFEAHSVNADSVDDATNIWAGDTGANATPNEYQRIDEIPPNTATPDYLYKSTSSGVQAEQFYAHAGFGLGTPEFITVGVVNLWSREGTSGTHGVASQVRLAGVDLPSAGITLINTTTGYRYEAPGFWITDPSGNDWTAANVDAALPGQKMFRFGGAAATDLRCHQILMYVVYGDDAEVVNYSLGTMQVIAG